MLKYKQKNNTLSSSKPKINVKELVREACSVYITKGRINNTASKLVASSPNCKRVAK